MGFLKILCVLSCSTTMVFCGSGRSRGLMLLFNPDETIDKISFDREKCEIVLSNLLMNAFKFSEEGTVVTVITERRESCVRISVKDHGIGLNESDLSHLFTRFYQGDHRLSGSGIGLSYSKTLLVLHGGEIGAYNNEDKGVTFWFELPLAYNDEDVACAPGMYLNDIGYATDMPETTVPEKDFSDLDVKYLTVEMGMSRASLYNKVKALTGLGVNDLINRIRIEQAMRLLTDTDIPIAEVSERIGFSNARYFSTCFKQFTSMAPREYREQKRNELSA